MFDSKLEAGPKVAGKGILALLAAFICLATAYSAITPLFEAPDELYHYPFVQRLAAGQGLPVQDPQAPGPWEQEGSQPPLYYALAALITRWVPLGSLPQINPHADIGLARPDGNANRAIHTTAETFQYHGAALAVHLARGLSVALGALTVLFTYLIGLELLSHRPRLALAAAAVVASTPMFIFISGSVNNDNLVIALATASLWLVLRLLRLPPTPARWGLLGTLVGLAALSKVSGLGLLAPAALALVWVAYRRHDWKLLFWGGACVVGAAAFVAGWWYVRNWLLYHDPLGWNAFIAVVGPRAVRPTLLEILGEWPGFFKSYWGVFGWFNVTAPAWFYDLCAGLALLGAGGLQAGLARRLWRRRGLEADVLFRFGLVAAWPLLVSASLIRWTLLTPASQGRLLFPAIAPLSYLLVLGWAQWLPRRILRNGSCVPPEARYASRLTHHVLRFTFCTLRVAPVALFAALAIWVPFAVIAPAYTRPPRLTPTEEAAIPQRLDLAVGDQMELLGYRLDQSEAKPGEDLALTLYWRAKAPMDKNYSVFIHLLDQNGMKIGQRDVYPGRGLFPTTLWQPGDAIADTYVISVPANTFRPNRLQFEVGLYSLDGGKPLPVHNAQGRELGGGIRLGDLSVRAEPKDGIANPADFDFDNKVALVGYDLDQVALHPGEALHLTLAWTPLASLSQGYTAFAHVVGPDGALWAGKVGSLAEGAALAGLPQKGQVIQRTYDLTLRPDTPPGDYYVEAGLYPAGTGQSLNVIDRWGHIVDRRALLTRIRVLPAAPTLAEPQSEFPPIQHPIDVIFGNVARLRGFSLSSETLNPHEPLQVTLYWEAIDGEPLPVSYKVFVHLLDAQGRLVAQHDSPPALGLWPVSSWVKGQAVVDRHDLVLKDVGYSGEAHLQVGLYDPQSLRRVVTITGEDSVALPAELRVAP